MVTYFKGQVFQTPFGIRFNVNTTKYSGSGFAISSKFERPFSCFLSDLYCAPSPLKMKPLIFKVKTNFVSTDASLACPCSDLVHCLVSGHHLVTPTSLTSFFHLNEAVEVVELKN